MTNLNITIKSFCVLVLSVLSGSDILAQTINQKSIMFSDIYQENTIFLKHNLFGTYFVKNGEEFSIGLFGGKLKSTLVSSDESLELIDSYAQNQKKFIAGWLLGMGSWWAGSRFIKSGKQTEGWTLYAVGSVFYLLSYIYSSQAKSALQKVVWHYNQQVLQEKLIPEQTYIPADHQIIQINIDL